MLKGEKKIERQKKVDQLGFEPKTLSFNLDDNNSILIKTTSEWKL
jgi:hypothetical protein